MAASTDSAGKRGVLCTRDGGGDGRVGQRGNGRYKGTGGHGAGGHGTGSRGSDGPGSKLRPGTYRLKASYGGATPYAASTSPKKVLTVTR